ANASGVVIGFAYVDTNGDHVRDGQDFGVPGVLVTLNGTTAAGHGVGVSAITDGSGGYTFQNVQPGTYQLGYLPVGGLAGRAGGRAGSTGGGGTVFATITVAGGQTVTQDLGFAGLDPSVISLRMFLSSSTRDSFGLPPAGPGQSVGSGRANNAPFLANP